MPSEMEKDKYKILLIGQKSRKFRAQAQVFGIEDQIYKEFNYLMHYFLMKVFKSIL